MADRQQSRVAQPCCRWRPERRQGSRETAPRGRRAGPGDPRHRAQSSHSTRPRPYRPVCRQQPGQSQTGERRKPGREVPRPGARHSRGSMAAKIPTCRLQGFSQNGKPSADVATSFGLKMCVQEKRSVDGGLQQGRADAAQNPSSRRGC